MFASRPFHLPSAGVLLFAAIVALTCVIPSLARPQTASAQSVYCGPYYGYQTAACPAFSGSPLGSCTSTAVDSNGNTFCTSLNTTSCPGGVTVTFGYPCPGNGCTGSGQCYNNPYGCGAGGYTPASYGAGLGCSANGGCGSGPAVVSCSGALQICNGKVTITAGSCNPQLTSTAARSVTASTTGVVACGNGQYAATAAGCSSASAAAANTFAATVTCQGTGLQASSQSQCPVACSNGQYLAAGSPCPASAQTTLASTSASVGTGPSNGVPVSYAAGWDLVSAPEGTVIGGVAGSLFTLRPGDTGYESLPGGSPAKSGYGYWAYFASSASMMLPLTTTGSVQVTLPAGTPVLIGNPGSSPATVTGADSVETFDPVSNSYVATTTLNPGQGAFAVSNGGGTITISN